MVEDAGNDIDIVGVGASKYENEIRKKAPANMTLAVLISITALMVNKNNLIYYSKIHCMYTTKYTENIFGSKTVDFISLQPKIPVHAREPNQ